MSIFRDIKHLSANKQFLRLWFALWQSRVGSLINIIALSLYVFEKTQSGAAVGFLEIAMGIPSIVLGLLAGVVADRFNRKWIMITSDIVRGALFFVMAFISDIPVIYAIVFGSSLVGLFFGPACSASIPLILEKDNLLKANSLLEMSMQIGRIIGPAIAGFLFIQFGFKFICIFNVITYVFSAILIISLRIPSPSLRDKKGMGFIKNSLSDILAGFQYIRSNNLIKMALFLNVGLQLGAGAIVVLVVMFVKNELNGSDAVYGMIISATAIGSLLGAGITLIGGKLSEYTILRYSLFSCGLSLLLISLSSTVWPVLLLFAIVGITQTTVSIIVNTLLQKHVKNEDMGRTFATMGVVIGSCQLLSMGAGGILADVIGVRAVYIIGSSIMIVTAIITSLYISISVGAEEGQLPDIGVYDKQSEK